MTYQEHGMIPGVGYPIGAITCLRHVRSEPSKISDGIKKYKKCMCEVGVKSYCPRVITKTTTTTARSFWGPVIIPTTAATTTVVTRRPPAVGRRTTTGRPRSSVRQHVNTQRSLWGPGPATTSSTSSAAPPSQGTVYISGYNHTVPAVSSHNADTSLLHVLGVIVLGVTPLLLIAVYCWRRHQRRTRRGGRPRQDRVSNDAELLPTPAALHPSAPTMPTADGLPSDPPPPYETVAVLRPPTYEESCHKEGRLTGTAECANQGMAAGADNKM